MAYTPLQASVFERAFSGALAGALAGRAPSSVVLTDYAAAANAALAYAEEFDTLYGTGGDSSEFALETIYGVSLAAFDTRAPSDPSASAYAGQAGAAIAATQETIAIFNAQVPGGTENAQSFRARNVVQTNVAALAAYTVAAAPSNDNVLNVKGDTVLLVAQTVPAQNGPYVVGTVAAGVAPLTRPSWWQAAAILQTGLAIGVGGEGTLFKNSVWRAMRAANTFTVGTNDPELYPEEVTIQESLGGGAPVGTVTIGVIPIRSASAGISITRTVAVTTAATVMYGAPTVTPGAIGTASLVVDAQDATGALNAADGSTLNITVTNQS